MNRIYLKHLVEIDRIGCLKSVEIDKAMQYKVYDYIIVDIDGLLS